MRLLITVVTFLAAWSSVCADTLQVGVILPLTGPGATYGLSAKEGLQTCPTSDKIEFIFEDDQCSAAKAVSAFQKLTKAQGTRYIIGPLCGGGQQAVAPLLASANIIALMPTTMSKIVYELSGKRAYSTAASAERESRFNAMEFGRLGYKKVALVYTDNDNSRIHVESFREAFRGEIVADISLPSADPTQYSTVLESLKRKDIDAIYAPDAALFFTGFMRRRNNLGMGHVPIYSIYAVQDPNIVEAEGAAADGLTYSYPKNTRNNAITSAAGTACELLLQTIAQCGSDTTCGRKELSQGNFDETGGQILDLELRRIRNGSFKTVD
jgi:branched-chain amino acid transport system substrate-binding protein